MNLEFAEPATEQEWETYYRLRYERLRRPLGLAPGSERDDPAEPGSSHLVAKLEGRVVGAGCWAVGMRHAAQRSERRLFVRYRQMAVDPEFEGRGIGSALMAEVERRARAVGAVEIVGNVRVENVALFSRQGWVRQGDGITLYDQVESVAMVKALR